MQGGGHASAVGIIRSNPEQSKHLETATMKLLGESIDFVHLRAETYSADSRIPSIELGSPSEDAFRRDFTVNSLFYDIRKRRIEVGLGSRNGSLGPSVLHWRPSRGRRATLGPSWRACCAPECTTTSSHTVAAV